MKSAFLAVPLLCGTFLYAQGPGFHRNASGTPPTPAQIAQNQTNRLTRFFNLNSTQESAVLGILTAEETQVVTLRTEIQPLHTTLVAAIKANNPTQINAMVQQISGLQEQIEAQHALAAGQIYATVLTSAQQAQLSNGLGPLMDVGGVGFRGRP
jgi:hypothetical protein